MFVFVCVGFTTLASNGKILRESNPSPEFMNNNGLERIEGKRDDS